MSIYLLFFLLILLSILWIVIEKANATQNSKINSIEKGNEKFEYKETVHIIESRKGKNPKLLFGENKSKKA